MFPKRTNHKQGDLFSPRLSQQLNPKICRLFVDKGYRGHKVEGKEVFISGKKKLTTHFKKLLKRHQAIEPIIGHMQSDRKLGGNYLKGKAGDCFNAILCGIGHNIRLILNHLFRIRQEV